MTNREQLWFWLGVALRDDELNARDIEQVRHGLEVVLACAHTDETDLISASWGWLCQDSPYRFRIQELVGKVWSEQFELQCGDPFKFQRYDQD